MESKSNNVFGGLVLRGPKPKEEEVAGGAGDGGDEVTNEEMDMGDFGVRAGVGEEEKRAAARLETKRKKRKAGKKAKQEKKMELMKEEKKERLKDAKKKKNL